MTAASLSVVSQTSQQAQRKQLGWRWLKFNLVGGVGIAVQLVTLWILLHGFHCNYLWATALAVETAVLHNFFWHHRFTWADRVRSQWRDIARRLLQFNLTNGAISIAGNVILMSLLAGAFHMPALFANMISIVSCSIINFFLSETYVFRR